MRTNPAKQVLSCAAREARSFALGHGTLNNLAAEVTSREATLAEAVLAGEAGEREAIVGSNIAGTKVAPAEALLLVGVTLIVVIGWRLE